MTFCILLIPGIFVLLYLEALLFSVSLFAQGISSTQSVEGRTQQLLSLFDEEWQYVLRTSPESATMLGDTRYNDRLSDESPGFFQSDLEQKHKFLMRFEAIDPAGFHSRTLSAAN